ncbi:MULTISPECIES: hypothetical protein [Leucobacter]|uniref:Lipoprotein n=1 Tax=Leucobacter luti TaxID=340320 RepID=A0A4Q7TXH6_9MICO|nr:MULTISPECIES: hypothetical protein [Leucobacter]MBL3698314.1 hypothetical protein [Leucobacter luti]RZT64598.1 hypothetical protein EV139_2017 [Leucobacter luti]UTX52153.1 hypothetical protein KI794_10300 [Leucobacter aridicollis]
MTKKTIKTTTALLAAGAMLLLAGCSSDAPPAGDGAPTESAEQGVFEFQTPRYGSDSGEVLIRLPEGLLDVVTDREMLSTEAVLTPRELGGAKYCAIDVEPRYLDGSQDVLKAPSESAGDHAAEASERYESLETWEPVEPEVVALFMDGTIGTVEKAQQYIAGGGQYADWVQGVLDEVGVGYYSDAPAWGLLRDAETISELDDADPVAGTYYSDDLSVITLVANCAASPADDGDMEFSFPAKVKEDGQIAWLGTVELSVMKSGTITVTEARVAGFVRDTDGNWIAD